MKTFHVKMIVSVPDDWEPKDLNRLLWNLSTDDFPGNLDLLSCSIEEPEEIKHKGTQ